MATYTTAAEAFNRARSRLLQLCEDLADTAPTLADASLLRVFLECIQDLGDSNTFSHDEFYGYTQHVAGWWTVTRDYMSDDVPVEDIDVAWRAYFETAETLVNGRG